MESVGRLGEAAGFIFSDDELGPKNAFSALLMMNL